MTLSSKHSANLKSFSLSILIGLLLLGSLTSHAQFSLDSCFEGGVEGYKNHFAKKGRIATMPINKGRYGLCLATMILSRDGKISQIEILSSPDSVYSGEVKRLFSLAEGMWRYPKSMPVDSIRLMAGVYFVKMGDDKRSSGTKEPHLTYTELYKDLQQENLNKMIPLREPVYFLGIVQLVRYAFHAVE